jgi:hypothetical protein
MSVYRLALFFSLSNTQGRRKFESGAQGRQKTSRDTAKTYTNIRLPINLCSQGPGTEVTSPEVYESIESE